MAYTGLLGRLAICFALADSGFSAKVDAQEPNPILLSDTTRFERPLTGGGRATFAIDLGADDFIQVVVEQKGIDVVAQLAAPDGTVLLTQDSPTARSALSVSRMSPRPADVIG
jgi:hypothetical protein